MTRFSNECLRYFFTCSNIHTLCAFAYFAFILDSVFQRMFQISNDFDVQFFSLLAALFGAVWSSNKPSGYGECIIQRIDRADSIYDSVKSR